MSVQVPGGDSSYISDIIPAVASVASAIAQGGPARQYRWNKRAMTDSYMLNQQSAAWQLAQQERLLKEQRAYDSPAAQMQRFKDAGLNPNLIYGSASGGNSPISAPSIAPARLDAPDSSYPDLAGGYIAASRGLASLDLTQNKSLESSMKQQSIAIQNEIAKRNPMLSPLVAQEVASAMLETAKMKGSMAYGIRNLMIDKPDGTSEAYFVAKLRAEVESMWKKLGLLDVDLSIKNKILESKEFDNALKEIQKKWLQDGELTPEHIRQGFMMILNKLL